MRVSQSLSSCQGLRCTCKQYCIADWGYAREAEYCTGHKRARAPLAGALVAAGPIQYYGLCSPAHDTLLFQQCWQMLRPPCCDVGQVQHPVAMAP